MTSPDPEQILRDRLALFAIELHEDDALRHELDEALDD